MEESNNKVIVIDPYTIDINGEAWEVIPRKQKPRSKIPFFLYTFLALGVIGFGLDSDSRSKTGIEAIDIVEEYRLIRLKKSKLSSNKRHQVVAIFERNFRRI